jgi:predicted Zn-dependent protease
MSSKIATWSARAAILLLLGLSFVPVEVMAQAAQQKIDPAQTERLKNVMLPLLAKMDNPLSPGEVKVALVDDDSINAGNAGGGNFLITTGLLKQANDEQLRAIMAHEMAHADLGHVADQQLYSVISQLGVALADQLFPSLSSVTPLVGQAFMARYSQKDELEADAHGVEILTRAGYDGKQLMGDTLSWLQKQEGASDQRGLAGFFATHPATGDRVEAVRNLP